MSDTLFSLPIDKQLTPYITLRQNDELPLVVINHPKCQAAITLQGAHLLAWQPNGQQPVIWLSDNTPFKSGKAIRGGVPICWPWFGKVAEPAHGFARNLPWELTAYSEDQEQVLLTFSLKDNDYTRQLWPHSFNLIARFKLGSTCEIELESFGQYQVTAALHTYFQIGDISQVSVSGLGSDYHDKVTKSLHNDQHAPLTFSSETDRVYTAPASCSLIHDAAQQRVIEVHHRNNSDVVAWNPGAEIACALADMTDEGYKTMVCVETASVSTPLTATEKNSARLGVTINVRSA